MMRLLFLMMICLTSFGIAAQENEPIKRISSGIKIGSELGFMGLKKSEIEANTSIDLGYSITLDFIEYRINDRFSANIGIGFTNRKYRQNIDNITFQDVSVTASGREYLTLQNVEIPFTGKYYFKNTKKTSRQHYLIGGTTINYNLHNDTQQKFFFADGTMWEYNLQNNIRRTTFSITLGAGMQIELRRRLSYVLEPMLQINPNRIDFSYGRDSNTLIAIGLMAGLKF